VGLMVGDVFYQLEERFTHATVGVHHEWNEFLVRSERGLLVLAIFDRLRGLDGLALGWLLPWRAWGWLAGSLALPMMCVIEVSSRRVVELARRPSARMSTLSSDR
jgi:hypothetical protein